MAEEQHSSPEELAQLSKQQCVFCHIAAGRVASKKVYEDEKVVAVLDINPANPGHVLIIPKEHYVIMPQIPEDILQHIGMVAKGISHAQLRALKVQGTNIFIANGVVAGQRAQHFMMHVIPRVEGDQIGFSIPERELSPTDAKKLQHLLKKALAKALGLNVEDEPETHEEEQVPHEEAKEATAKKEAPERKPAEKKKTPKKPAKGTNLDEIAKLFTGGS